MDTVLGLTNIMGGHWSGIYGPCNATQLVVRYKIDTAYVPDGLKILAINIKKSAHDRESICEAFRGFRRINVSRAQRADLVLAVTDGICRGGCARMVARYARKI